jgi:hypothetical protein
MKPTLIPTNTTDGASLFAELINGRYVNSADDDDGGPPVEVVEYVLVWDDEPEPEPEPAKTKDGGWFWFFLGALFGVTV